MVDNFIEINLDNLQKTILDNIQSIFMFSCVGQVIFIKVNEAMSIEYRVATDKFIIHIKTAQSIVLTIECYKTFNVELYNLLLQTLTVVVDQNKQFAAILKTIKQLIRTDLKILSDNNKKSYEQIIARLDKFLCDGVKNVKE